MEEDISIGYWIKRRRKALDMTQRDLAKRIGCALITIAKIEADERRPSAEMAALLAEHLEIPEEQRPSFIKTMRGLRSAVHLRKIGMTELQPVEPTRIPTVSAIKTEAPRELELISSISRSRLVARSAEISLAQHLWEAAKAGTSQVLIIQGEPGIGKSRLARELMMEIQSSSGQALVGECFAEGDMPYAPLARILQSGSISTLKLPQVVLADLKHIAPQLEVYLPDIPPNPPLDPQAEQLRLFEGLFTYFRKFYETKPLLLLIEDIHWADHSSLTALQSLIHRFRQEKAAVLLVLTTREVSSDTSPTLNGFFDHLVRAHSSTTVTLERFDQKGTSELLAAIFAQDVSDEFIQFIHRETQGNPFFIEEVCKDLLESRQVYWDQGRWERKNLTDLQVPQNIRSAVRARLDKLGKPTHELLETASLMGRQFEFDLLLHVMSEPEEALIERLEAAQRAQIVQETGEARNGGIFEFSHVLIATVLRESMSAPRRRAVHKRIKEGLQTLHPNEFSLLAYHCREAGDRESTAHYLRKAGDQAMSAFAHEDGIRFYSEALTFAPAGGAEASRILLSRAKVYDLRGQRSLQLSDLQEAEAQAAVLQETSVRAEIALARAEYTIQVAEHAEVIAYAQRAIPLSE